MNDFIQHFPYQFDAHFQKPEKVRSALTRNDAAFHSEILSDRLSEGGGKFIHNFFNKYSTFQRVKTFHRIELS